MENNKLTHGLLIEDFKQNLLNLTSQHALDIQSKAVVFDYINMQLQAMARQQTQIELEEYKAEAEHSTSDTSE